MSSAADGSYCEHGREVFDEEVEEAPSEKKGGTKKMVSEHHIKSRIVCESE